MLNDIKRRGKSAGTNKNKSGTYKLRSVKTRGKTSKGRECMKVFFGRDISSKTGEATQCLSDGLV